MIDESSAKKHLKYDFQYFDSSKVKTMKGIFKNSYAKEIDLSKFDTSNVTDMSLMFCDCYNLKKINLSNINTKNVTNMSGMFFNEKNWGNRQAFGGSVLESLDLSSFNTSNVSDMSYMFSGCSKLSNLDLSSFDTSKVEDMSYMFACTVRESTPTKLSGYASVISYPPVDGLGEGFVKNELTDLNLSSFNTSNVTNMESMFEGCIALKNLDLKNFNTSNVTNMCAMFAGCNSLTKLDLSSFDTSHVLYMQYMFSMAKYYEYGSGYGPNSFNSLPIGENTDTESLIDMTGITCNSDGNYVYNGKIVDNDDAFWISRWKPKYSPISSLTDINLKSFTNNNVVDMSWMFNNCISLENLDLSKFGTEKVKNMNNMFNNCKKLKSLDLSNFNTENVNSMYYMFSECSQLTDIDLSSFDISSVSTSVELDNGHRAEGLDGMFSGDSLLSKIYVYNSWSFDDKLYSQPFYGCTSLPNYNESEKGIDKCKLTSDGGYFTLKQ